MGGSELPEGWGARLYGEADLERSYQEIEGVAGSYAETLRGRVCLLQLNLELAQQHLQKATTLILAASDPDPEDALLNHAFCRELALLRGDGVPVRRAAPYVAAADSQLQRILLVHRGIDAVQYLQNGDAVAAKNVFQSLLENRSIDENRGLWHLGLAACALNCGQEDTAYEHLDLASLHAAAIGTVLGQARLAGRLSALYEHISRPREAAEWSAFLQNLRCPPATKEAMARRGEWLLARSHALRRVVLL